MPTGFTKKRLIGAWRTDDTADLWNIVTSGNGLDRWFIYMTGLEQTLKVVDDGTATDWTNTTIETDLYIPLFATQAEVNLKAEKLGGGELNLLGAVRPSGAEDVFRWVVRMGLNSGEDIIIVNSFRMPLATNRRMEYKINSAGNLLCSVYITGYLMSL